MAHVPTCALIAAVLALSAADLRAGIIRVTDIGVPGSAMAAAAHDRAPAKAPFAAAEPGPGAVLPSVAPEFAPGLMQAGPLAGVDSVAPDPLLVADAAAATQVPEAGTAALLAAALGAWLMLHAIIQQSRAARRARARGMAARTWSESRW